MHANIESHLVEKRIFKPLPAFSNKARIKSLTQYRRLYRESIQQPAKFWTREAKELGWRAPWKKVVEWKPPFAKWFVGGKLNVSENCLDRHLAGPRRNKAAIIWEGEPGDKRTLTYQRFHCWPVRESARCIQWSSADSAPIASATGSTTAARLRSSPPMARIVAAGVRRRKKSSRTAARADPL